MKIQFKEQQFQLDAIDSIVQLFQGQPKKDGFKYLRDLGVFPKQKKIEQMTIPVQEEPDIRDAFRNAPILLDADTIKKKVNQQQNQYGIKPSAKLSTSLIEGRTHYNFSIEMETGTGKTYTYIRTLMELNRKYGWLKFIIVVPSVAIREGVLKSFQMMEDHFLLEFGKKPRYFVYDSKRLSEIDHFATASDIQVMIINSQAFNATGKDARRIHMEQESFGWRKPIDVIAAMNPILIIDEPQSVEGKKTKERLTDFKPLFTLRYSATHKDAYDMVYRLDALDAYNQKLVKKIGVKTVEKTGTLGVTGYLYLQELIPTKTRPFARIEFEKMTGTELKRVTKIIKDSVFDLYAESGNLEAYKGWNIHSIDARVGVNSIEISGNGVNETLKVGEAIGNVNEDDLRKLQIRATIREHLAKEELLFNRGIKVLSLFFIDEVAKYKQYDANGNPYNGTYAETFEAEYELQVQDYLKQDTAYANYLRDMSGSSTHAGYFSVDKNKKTGQTKFVDSKIERGTSDSADVDAYDLIMKSKERLLSFEEPIRFIFSHSALKEGWDNPNVFQICTLKHSGAETRKRQEIGRGMRLCVDQHGVRQDKELLGDDAVHEINRLTVIANDSYENFSKGLQKELEDILKHRPVKVNVEFFTDKILTNEAGDKFVINETVAGYIVHEMNLQGYIDRDFKLTETYQAAVESGTVVFPSEVEAYRPQILELIGTVYEAKKMTPDNENETTIEFAKAINKENFAKQEFKTLWNKINHKSVYTVSFDDEELIEHSVKHINENLHVEKLSYKITSFVADKMSEEIGLEFEKTKGGTTLETVNHSEINIAYDLLGEIADATDLTRSTTAQILKRINPEKFNMFKDNPEDFILKVGKLINEQKATQIIKHIEYNILEEKFDSSLFTDTTERAKRSDKWTLNSERGLYHYTKVDSDIEVKFQEELEANADVEVYVKLPRGFKISTPIGNYNPDWAIAFKQNSVKHVYFVAETKGSMSSIDLKGKEQAKIECAKKHFQELKKSGIINDDRIYGVVDSYESLLEIVRG